MDKDISSIKMGKVIKENTLMTSEMGKVCLRIKMVQYMKVNGRIVVLQEMEPTLKKMDQSMLESGKMV